MPQWAKEIAKALVGAGLAALGTAGVAILDNHIDGGEWIAIATATLASLAAVWYVPNAKPTYPINLR